MSEQQQQTKPLYYWWDGYYITYKETADLMDSINAFGGEHGVVHVPMHWNDEQCQNHINGLLAEQAA